MVVASYKKGRFEMDEKNTIDRCALGLLVGKTIERALLTHGVTDEDFVAIDLLIAEAIVAHVEPIIRADEREACARVVDGYSNRWLHAQECSCGSRRSRASFRSSLILLASIAEDIRTRNGITKPSTGPATGETDDQHDTAPAPPPSNPFGEIGSNDPF